MNERWKTNSGCVYNIGYHIIFCPKYRRKVLVDGVDTRLKELLLEKSTANGWELLKLEIMPDHVHIFIKATPSDSTAYIVSQLKGYTAFMLRKEFPKLKSRLPNMWTRSYYVETVGNISQETVLRYIEQQKNK